MRLKILKILCLFLVTACSTLEFIPEPEYSPHYANYRKKTWEEVEIKRERPSQNFQIMAEVVIRNAQGSSWEELEPAIKRELFQRKMDGIWITEKKQTLVDSMSYETMDTRGHTTNSYKQKSVLPFWKGYAYRNK
ncbi:hypothetical protein P3G55_03280 [Leptospira sp. 96542]|nr:hypothetical protein [Leptospira sp. 96542]